MKRTKKPARDSHTQQDTRGSRSFVLCVVLLTAMVIAVYGRICRHDFVSFDDYLHLHENPHFNPPTLSGLSSLWRAPYRSQYVPLSYTVFALEAWLAQLPPE